MFGRGIREYLIDIDSTNQTAIKNYSKMRDYFTDC